LLVIGSYKFLLLNVIRKGALGARTIMAPTTSTAADSDIRDTLQAALDMFKTPCTSESPLVNRQQLRDLAEKQKQAAAKAALLASSSPSPAPAELAAVRASLVQAAAALLGGCWRGSGGAGPSLGD
ncbi:hypothetical protein Agub_g7472, partial [Astrephomene gubernaculifera]